MKIHKSITVARIIDAIKRRESSLDNPGFCIKCGYESNSCEPDARNYMCAWCGEKQVFGAEELVLEFFC